MDGMHQSTICCIEMLWNLLHFWRRLHYDHFNAVKCSLIKHRCRLISHHIALILLSFPSHVNQAYRNPHPVSHRVLLIAV